MSTLRRRRTSAILVAATLASSAVFATATPALASGYKLARSINYYGPTQTTDCQNQAAIDVSSGMYDMATCTAQPSLGSTLLRDYWSVPR
jgi:hypothetical protein